MNRSEAARLLSKCAAFDNRTVTDAAVHAWAEALADVPYSDAMHVVTEHYRSNERWLMPAHIIDGVKRLRRARLDAVTVPAPPVYLDVADDLAWRRAYIEARAQGEDDDAAREVASGMLGIETPHEQLTTRPVAQLIEQTARALPRAPRS